LRTINMAQSSNPALHKSREKNPPLNFATHN
jgi:hypothetical protein